MRKMPIIKRLNVLVLVSSMLVMTSCGQHIEDNKETTDTVTAVMESSEASTDSVVEATKSDIEPESETVILGDARFDEYLPLLKGKRVALFSNHTGIVGDECSYRSDPELEGSDMIPFGKDDKGDAVTYGEHILDALVRNGIEVVNVFCPEHGFRGQADAGEEVGDSIDPETGVKIVSLYGGNDKALSQENMDAFDVLVVDIQDVGLRFYTYYITMLELMDACASFDKEVVILDRPNPNGFYVDGPILEDGLKSNVGRLPIPVVHGMTLGEMAQFINGEGYLKAGANSCKLTVIPCENYDHSTKYYLIKAPSPNLKDMRAVYLYASTCLFENTAVSVGRGTDYPFETFGSPYLAQNEDYSYTFIPMSIPGANDPPFEGQECFGKDLRELSFEEASNGQIRLEYLVDAYNAVSASGSSVSFWENKDKNGHYWIDYLMGQESIRQMIENGDSCEAIRESWQTELNDFLSIREKYLIYDN